MMTVTEAGALANAICGCSTKEQHLRDIALIEAYRQQAEADERARVVAWLRVECEDWLADLIERGDHRAIASGEHLRHEEGGQ